MAKANINALPPELIIFILRTVHLTEVNSFLSCLRVNRTWHSYARELLYANVVLTPETFKRFCRRFRSSVNGILVRSVTINLPSNDGEARIPDIQPWRYENGSDTEADSEISSNDEDDDEGQADESDGDGNGSNVLSNVASEKAGPKKEDQDNEPDYLSDRDDNFDEYAHYFRFLTRLMPRLPRLLSFSFLIPECTTDHSISHDQFVLLINALPVSCTSLEVEIDEWSDGWTDGKNTCFAVRQILPRMEHVRLQLPNMCSELFLEKETSSDGASNNGAATLKPVSMPKIKTLLVYCSYESCFSDKDDPVLHSIPQSVRTDSDAVWHGVTQALQVVVENRDQSSLSRSAKVLVIDLTVPEGLEDTTYIYADMTLQTTAVIPRLFMIGEKGTPLYIFRTVDGQEVCGEHHQLESLTEFLEGEVWRTAIGGARLPDALLNSQNSFARNCVVKVLGIITLEEWRESNGLDLTCDLWVAEEKAGTRLVCAEERSGVEKYLSRKPLDSKWKGNYALRRLYRQERHN